MFEFPKSAFSTASEEPSKDPSPDAGRPGHDDRSRDGQAGVSHAARAGREGEGRARQKSARMQKFERERLIVEYLNRGVSVAEIATRFDVGEKRMRAVIREILERRMPAPPWEFVAIQVSRLHEALLVAYGAMSPTNLKAVAEVRRLVRELDRYHGFSPTRLPAPAPREEPVFGAPAFGAAFARPDFSPEEPENIDSAPGDFSAPEADPVDAGLRQDCQARFGWLGPAVETAPIEPAVGGSRRRPEIPAQRVEKLDSGPGSEARDGEQSKRAPSAPYGGRRGWTTFLRRSPAAAALDAGLSAQDEIRPELPPQGLENMESAPGLHEPREEAPAGQTFQDRIGAWRARMMQNGAAADAPLYPKSPIACA